MMRLDSFGARASRPPILLIEKNAGETPALRLHLGLVRAGGIEPPRAYAQRILSRLTCFILFISGGAN